MYPEFFIIVLLILSLFIVAALIILSATQLTSNNRNILTGLWGLYGVEFFIVAAVLIPAYFDGIIFITVLLLFNLRAHLEIAHIHGYGHKINIVSAGVLLSSVLVISGFYFLNDDQWINYILSSVVLIFIIVLFILIVMRCQRFIIALFPMIIIVLSLSCLMHINAMNDGILLIIFLYLVTETNDAFALVFGKIIGRTRLFPRISPKKTWEGMIGGALTAMLAGLTYNHYVLEYSLSDASLIIGLIITSAIFGDMAFSIYKRAYRTKDFMIILKGHGGIIDIYDSLLVSSIIFYLLIQFNGLSNSA